MNRTINREPLWTPSFVKICLVNFFIFVNFHALLPAFPFFVAHLGGTAVTIGVATALFSVASIVARPFAGWLADTRGRRAVLLSGLIGMALIPMGYFLSAGIAVAVALRTLHGAFHAASSNSASTWVTDIVPPARMGEGLGMYGLSMALSTAAAPAIGLALMEVPGFEPYQALFAFTALSALVALFLSAGIRQRTARLSTEPIRLDGLFERTSVPASVTQFFFMMAYGVVEVYVAFYAATIPGLPGGGIYFIAMAAATVLTRFALGRAIDSHGEAPLVYTGNAALIAGILLLVFIPNAPCYILSGALMGCSFGAVQPALQTMAMHSVAPERRGAANSTFFVAFDLGIALGGLAAGMLLEHFGYRPMFLVIALSGVCSIAYYHVFGRTHESSFNPAMRQRRVDSGLIDGAAGRALPFVVTISREYGSGGHRIGKLLAERLGVKLYDKNLISLTAHRSGLDEESVKESGVMADSRLEVYDAPVQTAVFQAQSRIIHEVASRESCVIVGRLANFVLRAHKRCFRVFIYAGREDRIRRVTTRYGVPAEAAEETLRRLDRERRAYCLHYTGGDWGARRHYNLMVDSSLLGEEGTAALLEEIVRQRL